MQPRIERYRIVRSAWMSIVALAVLTAPIKSIVADEITAAQVRASLDKGVEYLKRELAAGRGALADPLNITRSQGGVTCLATLALLSAGVEPTDPVMQQALAQVRRFKPEKTYVTALQTMALCRAVPTQDLAIIRRNVEWLQAHQTSEGPFKGGWSYPPGSGDPSNAQFAILALYDAEQAGVKVNPQCWRLAKAYWENIQNPDGSWGYSMSVRRQTPGTGSMTCAGIASLVMIDDSISAGDAQVIGDRIDCCSRGQADDQAARRGLEWLERHFSYNSNPGPNSELWVYYYLYAVERVGRLTARRFIGKHDWYREIAAYLAARQDRFSGYWVRSFPENDPHIATSLVLLFLAKGRRPVLVAKLKQGAGDDWNQHRADVANLTRYVESRWRRELTWQVIDFQAASVEDLLQAPVLYYCGSKSPLPDADAQRKKAAQKLRDYIDRGGFIFAEAYCGGTGFDRGFRQLMELVFPEPEYRLRLLPPEHPVWRTEENVEPAEQRPLLGVEYGCRTSVIYAPLHPEADPRPALSCLWELSRTGREQHRSKTVETQIQAGLSIGVNVLAYATNREVRGKDELIAADHPPAAPDSIDRGRIRVASILHPGGCSAAPRALTNLLETAARELKLRVDPDTRRHEIRLSDPRLFDYHLAFMHGRNHFHLTEAERKQLKLFIERGGILLADSICASEAFSQSFRREINGLFPDHPLQLIPAEDPLYTPFYGGGDIRRVKRRDPAARDPREPLRAVLRETAPSLEAVKAGERYGVIFSPFDLSCALEKQDSLECQGYTRDDAARIGLNLLMYSFHQ